MTADELVDSIRLSLRDAADPAIAPGQQAYMKSTMPFLGVRVPAVRAVVKQHARGITDSDLLRDAALRLWREAVHREERYAATALTGQRPLRAQLDMLDAHEEMIRTGAWWDHVDEVAGRVTDTLDAHPVEVTQLLLAWTGDEDMWIRRASIISQLRRKDDTDRQLLTIAIESNLEESEFFIRKAIGWALRDYAKTDQQWVRDFVDSHDLSPLSRREALKGVG